MDIPEQPAPADLDPDLADATPCGRIVEATATEAATTVQLDRLERLKDGDRVRLAGPDGEGPLAFVKLTGPNTLGLFEDTALSRPARNLNLGPGLDVIRLARDDWAVVVALNFYSSPGLRALKGALEDANQFARWLRQVACVPDDQVKIVPSAKMAITDVANELPTPDIAWRTLSSLGTGKPPGKGWGRRLYIFCSGHGILPTRSAQDYREAALLLAGAAYDNGYGKHIPTRGCAEFFRATGLFQQVVLLVDCCRDLDDRVQLANLWLPLPQFELPEGRGFYAIPTQIGSKSYEDEFGEPKVWRGIFSYRLIEALNDPTLCDRRGVLTGSLLRDRIYADFPQLGDPDDAGNKKQAPAVEYDLGRADLDIVRRHGSKVPQLVVTLDPARAGEKIQLWVQGLSGLKPLATREVARDGTVTFAVGNAALYKVADAAGASKTGELKGAVTYDRFP